MNRGRRQALFAEKTKVLGCNSGLATAYKACKLSLNGKQAPVINGLTAAMERAARAALSLVLTKALVQRSVNQTAAESCGTDGMLISLVTAAGQDPWDSC